MTLREQLSRGLAGQAGDWTPATLDRLVAFLELIDKWNRVHNLTAIREPERMVVLHLLDSLAILPHMADARTLLDVGSGAGLPGIPLAIARPDLAVTLLDASHKKASFLRQARAELALTNVEVVCERVERWHPGTTFDVVVSRAFADLADFVELAGRLAGAEGTMLAMKGVHPHEEIARVPAGFRVENVVTLHVPDLDAQRHLVLLKAA